MMMSDDDKNALLQEIRGTHGVTIDKDDPIMMILTINSAVLRDAAAQQQRIIEAFKADMEGVANRLNLQAKGIAESVLTAALTAGKAALSEELQKAGQDLRREFVAAADTIQQQLHDTRQAAMLNVIAAALVGVGVVLAALLLK